MPGNSLVKTQKGVEEQRLPAEVAGLGSVRLAFAVAVPEQVGNYQVEAVLLETPAGPVIVGG